MHRILADPRDSGLVFAIGQQIGHDPVSHAHRQTAVHIPLIAAQCAPPAQPQVPATWLVPAGHVELVRTSDNVSQPEGVRRRPVTGHRVRVKSRNWGRTAHNPPQLTSELPGHHVRGLYQLPAHTAYSR